MHHFLQSRAWFSRILICVFSIMLSSCTSKSLKYDQQQEISQALQHTYQFQQQPATLAALAAFYVTPTSF